MALAHEGTVIHQHLVDELIGLGVNFNVGRAFQDGWKIEVEPSVLGRERQHRVFGGRGGCVLAARAAWSGDEPQFGQVDIDFSYCK